MANEQVIDTFTTAVAGTVYEYRKAKGLDILAIQLCNQIDGVAFVGTVKLQTSIPNLGSWIDVPSGSYTANTSGTFVPGGDMDIRWNCTSYTSGTIRARIG